MGNMKMREYVLGVFVGAFSSIAGLILSFSGFSVTVTNVEFAQTMCSVNGGLEKLKRDTFYCKNGVKFSYSYEK